MKGRTIAEILIVALAVVFIGVTAAQYDQGGDAVCDNSGICPGFSDDDADGVCDNRGICGRGYCGGGGCGVSFVDDGDGRDDDNDSIPNGQDDEYEPPRDGSGNRGQERGCNR
jgi:hypothetical protein